MLTPITDNTSPTANPDAKMIVLLLERLSLTVSHSRPSLDSPRIYTDCNREIIFSVDSGQDFTLGRVRRLAKCAARRPASEQLSLETDPYPAVQRAGQDPVRFPCGAVSLAERPVLTHGLKESNTCKDLET